MRLTCKYWIFVLFVLVLAACSPKVRTVDNKPKKVEEEEKKSEKKPVKKFSQANIALLLPFQLHTLNLKSATKAELEKYAMPIDFYQGLKLGMDSAAALGLNIKLNVLDTQDDAAQITGLYKQEDFKQSNLVIGPVFPEGIKSITAYSKANNLTVVSPLAASLPAEFGNQNLISIVNNIELHARKIAAYIAKTYSPANTIVVLINPKKADDEQFAAPIRSYFQRNGKYTLQEYASVFSLEPKLVKGKQYVIIVTSSDRAFVSPSIDKLYKLKTVATANYPVNLFGHPLWAKQSYPAEKLQAMNTIISSSYKVDYKSSAVMTFIKKYRAQFGFEPGEYAFKGFDIGYYFGRLLANYGEDYVSHLTKEKYKGLQNNFSFVHDEKNGYINTSLMLLKYKNFALNVVE